MGDTVDVEGSLERRDDLLRDVSCAALVRARKDQRELVPAQTRHGVGLPQVRPDPLRDLADEKVSGAVPERVVDLLEAVEVHHQQGQGRREPPRGPKGLLEPVEKEGSIGQTGERVVQRLPLELVLGLLAIGDVREARDDLANAPERVLDRDGVDEKPAHIPVGPDHPHHHVADGLAPRLRRDVRHLVVGHRGPVLANAAVLARRLAGVELVGRASEDQLGGRVGEDDRAGRVADHDAARHRVIDGAKVALRS